MNSKEAGVLPCTDVSQAKQSCKNISLLAKAFMSQGSPILHTWAKGRRHDQGACGHADCRRWPGWPHYEPHAEPARLCASRARARQDWGTLAERAVGWPQISVSEL